MAKIKVGIIVGHDHKKRGAKLNLNSEKNEPAVYEYEWNTAVARQIEFLSGIYGIHVDIHFRDGLGIYGAYLAAANNKPNLILELHFNSTQDNTVAGAEVICSFLHADHKFPNSFLPRCVKMFGGKNRGIKIPDKDKDRGYINVNRPIPYLLLEPFFGSNLEQAKIASEQTIDYAILIMDSLREYENEFNNGN